MEGNVVKNVLNLIDFFFHIVDFNALKMKLYSQELESLVNFI